jgi:hypothetical protein
MRRRRSGRALVPPPGRFAGLWTIDPSRAAGVRRAAEALAQPHTVGLLLHTHSWIARSTTAISIRSTRRRRARRRSMQAGASGGPLPSECGRPAGIDRPAIYFGAVRFVLSHTGWPWTGEAIAMAHKHANVYLGTAAWPPHRWPTELIDFIAGAGQGKALLGTGFPVTGHRQASRCCKLRSRHARALLCARHAACSRASRRRAGMAEAPTVSVSRRRLDDPASARPARRDARPARARARAGAAQEDRARRVRLLHEPLVMPANFRMPAHHHDHDEPRRLRAAARSTTSLPRRPRRLVVIARTPTTASPAAPGNGLPDDPYGEAQVTIGGSGHSG